MCISLYIYISNCPAGEPRHRAWLGDGKTDRKTAEQITEKRQKNVRKILRKTTENHATIYENRPTIIKN